MHRRMHGARSQAPSQTAIFAPVTPHPHLELGVVPFTRARSPDGQRLVRIYPYRGQPPAVLGERQAGDPLAVVVRKRTQLCECAARKQPRSVPASWRDGNNRRTRMGRGGLGFAREA